MLVIVVARKPLVGSVAKNVLLHGTGGLNIDGTRIGLTGATTRSEQVDYPKKPDGHEDRSGSWARTGHAIVPLNLGRWPANLILQHLPGCQQTAVTWDCPVGCPVAALDNQSGERRSALTGKSDPNVTHANPATHAIDRSVCYGYGLSQPGSVCYADSGGASRFFKQVRS